MRWLAAALTLLFAACTQPPPPTGPAPVLKRSIPLPGVSGRIDHLAFDPSTQRLFVAALESGSLEVVDLDKGERTKSITGLKEPQGLVIVPAADRSAASRVVVACGGDGTARAYNASTLEQQLSVDVGDDADNVRLSADGKHIIVGYADGALAILDATTLQRAGEIKLAGHPESFQVEPGSSRVFVNVPGGFVGGGGAVAVADLASQKVTSTWTLREAGRNFPMALDAPHKRLYVGCRRSAKLLVIDTDSGAVVASPECVGDADDVFVDAKTGRVIVVGGDGAIDTFETKDQHAYVRISSVPTPSGARTGLFVAERRALYIAVPRHAGQAAEIREFTLPE